MSSFDNEYFINTNSSTQAVCNSTVAIGITLFCVLYIALKSPTLTQKTLNVFKKWYAQAIMIAVIVFVKTQSLTLAIVYSLAIVAALLALDKVIENASNKQTSSVPAINVLAEHVTKTVTDNVVENTGDIVQSDDNNEFGNLLDDAEMSYEHVDFDGMIQTE